jgi:hypothetical protein
MEKEVWKDIEGYEGLYQVSSLGNVKSLGRRKSVAEKGGYYNLGDINLRLGNRRGYKSVTLCKDGIPKPFAVHRLVAFAFLENKENKKTVNHINGIKSDNRVDNLEWVSQSEQQIHAIKIGLRYKAIGEQSNFSKFKSEDIIKIREMYSTGLFSCEELSKKFNTSKNNINSIIHSYTWKHLGFDSLIGVKKVLPSNKLKVKPNDFPIVWHLYYVNKLNYAQISNIFGCWWKTISNIINKKDKHLTYYNNAQYKQSF